MQEFKTVEERATALVANEVKLNITLWIDDLSESATEELQDAFIGDEWDGTATDEHGDPLVHSYWSVIEFWVISEALYRRLYERNETMGEFNGDYLWGRRTAIGQKIADDSVIRKIAANMMGLSED